MALQIGHRVSVDLDFFGHRPFETQELLDELHDLAPLSIMSQSKNILVLNAQGMKVDFVNYRYPLVAVPLLMDGLRLLTLPDIGAMKLAAIAGRDANGISMICFSLSPKHHDHLFKKHQRKETAPLAQEHVLRAVRWCGAAPRSHVQLDSHLHQDTVLQ